VTPFVKWIFPKIKTCFQGGISKCKNEIDFSKKHASKVEFQNVEMK
jgi:hypothetical protein